MISEKPTDKCIYRYRVYGEGKTWGYVWSDERLLQPGPGPCLQCMKMPATHPTHDLCDKCWEEIKRRYGIGVTQYDDPYY